MEDGEGGRRRGGGGGEAGGYTRTEGSAREDLSGAPMRGEDLIGGGVEVSHLTR